MNMKYYGNFFDKQFEGKEVGLALFKNYLKEYYKNNFQFHSDSSEIVFCENEDCRGYTSSIIMLDNKECGIFLQFDSSALDGEYYSLASDLTDEFCELGDNIFFPKSCCLNPVNAIVAIEEFFLNGKELPKSISYVSSKDTEFLNWPEM